ncbi:MAG: PilZ domain-containing protein [Angelakisella sp.]
MLIGYDFKGCQVMIRDDADGELIANTKILDFDKALITIVIDAHALKVHSSSRVSLLILHDSEILEFQGNIRKTSSPGRVQIALFKGRVKEDRASKRYQINAPATIENIVTPAMTVKQLGKPLGVTVLNLSTVGALVQAPEGALELESKFQLKIKIGISDTIVNSVVVRSCQVDENNASAYGCKFLSATEG